MSRSHDEADDIANAVVRRFYPYGRWLVCDGVSWGIGLNYEADVIAVGRDAHTVHEVEVKISRSDLLRDQKKRKFRWPPQTDCMWYAVPENLADVAEDVARAVGAGLYVVMDDDAADGFKHVIRKFSPKRRPVCGGNRGAIGDRRRIKNILYHLIAARYWSQRLNKARPAPPGPTD